MCTIARRLYSNHTHLKEEQQCHDEDEQTRKRSELQKNEYITIIALLSIGSLIECRECEK